jgi:putative flavoprotein involved in K+ transport
MHRTHTIVIGGGQAGLAVSRCLRDAGLDHVVLERGRLAERWRSERWDSLHLLTPNWMSRLPGWSYDGDDPDGFMAAGDLVHALERYAGSFAAPVEEHTTVEAVTWDGRAYTVTTDRGSWQAPNIVVATGHAMEPRVPSFAASIDRSIHQQAANQYRRPAQLPDGGVLVVGASATGTQLAEELAVAGRDVVLAVGGHSRMPRTYRGLDIFTWMHGVGLLDDHIDDHPRPDRAPRSPSMQLVGAPDRRNLDLATCQRAGAQLAGRLGSIDGTHAAFETGLDRTVARAEQRMHRMLDTIDRYVRSAGLEREIASPDRPSPVQVGHGPGAIDLAARNITTVLWATGFDRRYPWLPAAALDDRGEIRHRHGIGALPRLYVVGLRYQRHRSSNFIGGVGADARHIVDHLIGGSPDEEIAA